LINRQKVLSLIATLRALEEGFEAEYAELIDYAVDWAQSVAVDGSISDSRLDFLAAAKLNYLLAVGADGSGSVASFKAGDISVKEDCAAAIKAAKDILDSALCDADALVNLKSGFAFIGV
jgi:hypothetical protein